LIGPLDGYIPKLVQFSDNLVESCLGDNQLRFG
jgi:hypothetical protein